MHRYLTKQEISVAKKMINISLANAAESFSKLAKEKVVLQPVEIPPVEPNNNLNHMVDLEDSLYVLKTVVKGELPAESYLIFTSESADEICRLIIQEPNVNDELKNAVLLEVDNILTASVVTQFSDYFDLNLYGDVPSLHRWKKKSTEDKLEKKMTEYDIQLSFKTSFITSHFTIFPEFIWILTNKFIDAVKKLSSLENLEKKFKNHEKILMEYIQYK